MPSRKVAVLFAQAARSRAVVRVRVLFMVVLGLVEEGKGLFCLVGEGLHLCQAA